VKWNEPYQKLASCDSSGVINVWAKFDCRWNVELINDRNTKVTYFSWSHDGRLALICYQVSFILIFNNNGLIKIIIYYIQLYNNVYLFVV